MVAATELVHTVDVGNLLGEAVAWNEERQSAWWTDIESSKLFEFEPVSGALRTWDTPHRVACFGFVGGSERLIVAFDQGIALYDPPSAEIEWLVAPGALAAGLRFNDGKVDPRGRFWVGSMVEDATVASGPGALYCLEPGGMLAERIDGVKISNGLCWSPDGTVMYHADSPRHSIRAYRFDPRDGTLSDGRLFASTAAGVHPDGSTADSDGGVWNAQWGGGQVVRYAADGQRDTIIDLPVSQPTCVAFGGENLDLLFVTSARLGLSDAEREDEPLAGGLLVYRSGHRGLPAPRFRRKRHPGLA